MFGFINTPRGSAPAKKKDAPWKNVFGCPKCKQIYFFSGVVRPGSLEICCNFAMKKINSKAEFEALLEE